MSLPTSPASAAAGAAPGPPATFTPSGINPAGAIPQLWIPVALLAHIFAIAFLVKFFLLLHPDLPGKARSRLRELLEAGRARWGGRPGCGQARVAAEEATGAALAAVVEAAKMKAADGSGSSATTTLASAPSLQSLPSSVSEICASEEADTEGEQEQGGGSKASSASAGAMLRRLSTHVSHINLEWRNLGCTYNSGGGTKVVLQGVYGSARPGEMQALLGPSGAGKSTLMDILALRKSVGSISGRLLVNGQPASKAFIRKTAYVPQADNFVPTMTTEETLTFFAALMLPAHMGGADKAARVKEVLAALGLSHTAHTLVGGQLPGGLLLRGLSGGERKRLSIAAGIIATPSVVFLDEPTSGLDSFAALTVMGHLKRMAGVARQVVIASIHQPRSAIWNMFHTVLVLSGGRMMFTGPTSEVVPWFSTTLGYAFDPTLHGVTSDWVMDLVSVAFSKPKQYYGHTMRSGQELQQAADSFKARYLAEHRLREEQQGELLGREEEEEEEEEGQEAWADGAGLQALQQGDVEQGSAVAAVELPALRPVQAMVEPESSVGPGDLQLPSRSSTINSSMSFISMITTQPAEEPASNQPGAGPVAEASEAPGRQVVPRRVTFVLPARSSSSASLERLDRASPADIMSAAAMAAAADASSATSPATSSSAAAAAAAAAPAAAGVELSKAMLVTAAEIRRRPTPFPGSAAAPAPAAGLIRQGSATQQRQPQSIVNIEKMMAGLRAAEKKSERAAKRAGRRYATSWGRQYLTLLWRETLAITRNPADVAGRMLTFVWVALLVGFIYYDLEPLADSIGLRLNLLFSNICFFMLMPYISMSLFAADKQFYVADISARIYRPSAYYAAKATAHAPFGVLSAVVFCLVTYGMAGFRASSGIMARYTLLNVLLSLIANQVLHLAATLTPNQDMAFMLAILWTAVNLLMSNYFVTYSQIAYGWFSQLRYLSAVGFAFDGVTQEEFRGVGYNCSSGLGNGTISFMQALLPNTAVVQSRLFADELTRPSPGCVVSADAVLEYYEAYRPFAATAAILVAYLAVMHLLSFTALLKVARKERR